VARAPHPILVIAHLTLREAARRKILVAALIAGAAFLALFGLGLFFVVREIGAKSTISLVEKRITLNVLTLAGLYATNMLTIMTAVLLPVDTLSGEIGSGVIQTVAVRPIRRRDIVLGKWLGHWIVMAGYFALVAGGLLAITATIAHFTPPRVEQGLPLMLLAGSVLLTVSIAGGARLSTVTNGILAFGLYGMAFIGNWVEQIGAFADNTAAQQVGTIASLLMPSESMWQLAAAHMQPTIMRELGNSPFSAISIASPAMIWWALGYVVVALAVGVRSFEKRPL
jgi:ABC-type transport system involved in multi-copper enzyme maturation permease subunit